MDLTFLIVAAFAFLLTHLGLSSHVARTPLIDAIGPQGFLGFYSVVAFATLGWLIYEYSRTQSSIYLWLPGSALFIVTKVLVFVACLSLFPGVLSRNPTAVMQQSALENEPSGMLRITRHPVQWGILLWSLGHLIANGDVRSLVFFGSFAVLAAIGPLLSDRRKMKDAETWSSFMGKTSNLPFAAIIAGRNKLEVSEISWIGVVIGVVAYGLIYVGHGWISGVSLF